MRRRGKRSQCSKQGPYINLGWLRGHFDFRKWRPLCRLPCAVCCAPFGAPPEHSDGNHYFSSACLQCAKHMQFPCALDHLIVKKVKTKRVSGSAPPAGLLGVKIRTPLRLTQVPYEYFIFDVSDPLHGCPSWACKMPHVKVRIHTYHVSQPFPTTAIHTTVFYLTSDLRRRRRHSRFSWSYSRSFVARLRNIILLGGDPPLRDDPPSWEEALSERGVICCCSSQR